MANSVQNIKVEPCNATWEIEEQWQVQCFADDAGSLNDKYFFIYDEIVAAANQKFHVWLNVGGAGVNPDPDPGVSSPIPVAVSTNASAAAIATAIAAAVDALPEFLATADGDKVLITVVNPGQSSDFADGNSGFVLTQCQDGGYLDLGYLDGDIEISFEQQELDVTAHQTGTTVLASFLTGLVNEVTMTMKELSNDKLKELMLGTAGGSHTPVGGSEVFGWGSATIGQNQFVKARRLILHPVALPTNDKSRDICFWKAAAAPQSMVKSGENFSTLPLTFKVYKDESKPAAVDQFVFKDWTQFLPA